MIEPELRIPISCPVCGRETLSGFPVSTVASALLSGIPLTLRADCHEWCASANEMEQIREYLSCLKIPSFEGGSAHSPDCPAESSERVLVDEQ